MKFWLSHLPLEVWVDVYRYPWISREELGRIVDRFSNRKFAEYLQFYLHDWGKHRLKNRLYFEKDGFHKYVRYAPYRLNMDCPLTPMPDKIISFELIFIRHFDTQAIAFLRQIRPILTDVNLELAAISPNDLDNVRAILVNVLPMIDGIHSLKCDTFELPTVKQCLAAEFSKLKMLSINDNNGLDGAMQQTTVNLVADWLTTSPEQNGNGPKLCELFIYNDPAFGKHLSLAIQQFFDAKTPSTFALIFRRYNWRAWHQFVEFHLTNNIGEELHGVKMEQGFAQIIQITRHQPDCNKEMQEFIEEANIKKSDRQIWIYSPTIGSIDAIDVPENEGKDPQPSTSKEA